jgi:hypothetical protein
LNLPPVPEIPEAVRGKSFVIVEAIHAGDPGDPDQLLAPLRPLAPINDTLATISLPALAHLQMDPEQPVPGFGDALMLSRLDVPRSTRSSRSPAPARHSHWYQPRCDTSRVSSAARDRNTARSRRSTPPTRDTRSG